MIDISRINGKEIVDFLNKVTGENRKELIDVSIGSFEFEKQERTKKEYKLYFTGSYNNWGTDQDISGNVLYVTKDDVWFHLEEPFEGDGSDHALVDVLKPWLETHEFDANREEKFADLLDQAKKDLGNTSYKNNDKLQGIIDKLVEAKSWI